MASTTILSSIILSTWLALVSCIATNQDAMDMMLSGLEKYAESYRLPRLPYSYDAFEPMMDADTMKEHHQTVHEEKTLHLNRLLQEWRKAEPESKLAKLSLTDILQNIEKVPSKWKEDLRKYIGGYLNHLFYFATLSPNPTNAERPRPKELEWEINRSFGNFSNMQGMFTKVSKKVYASGWVFLTRVPKDRYLTILSLHADQNPLSVNGMQPILGIDLWEHSYWTKYKNKRDEYISNWWKMVDYEKVESVLRWWKRFDPKHDEL